MVGRGRAIGLDEGPELRPLKPQGHHPLEHPAELVEITPKSIRLRKRFLKEHERKRSNKPS